MRNLFVLPLLFVVLLLQANSQSMPTSAFNYADKTYKFEQWSPDAPAGTYPPNMIFHTSSKRDPVLADTMNGDWSLAYNLTSDSRILGLGADGICFANTSNAASGSGYLGAAVFAMQLPDAGSNGLHINSVTVRWSARTIDTATRRYGIALQYSTDSGKTYTNMDEPYIQNPSPGAVEDMYSRLSLTNFRPMLVLFRWKYFYFDGESGKRSRLGIDNIEINFEEIPLSANEESATATTVFYSESDRSLVRRDCSYPAELVIFSALGECVFSSSMQSGERIIRIPALPTGAYFVSITNGTQSGTTRFVVAN